MQALLDVKLLAGFLGWQSSGYAHLLPAVGALLGT